MRYHHRVRRRNLTPAQLLLKDNLDKIQMRCDVLTRGISHAFKNIYSLSDLEDLLEIVAELRGEMIKAKELNDQLYGQRLARTAPRTAKNTTDKSAKGKVN